MRTVEAAKPSGLSRESGTPVEKPRARHRRRENLLQRIQRFRAERRSRRTSDAFNETATVAQPTESVVAIPAETPAQLRELRPGELFVNAKNGTTSEGRRGRVVRPITVNPNTLSTEAGRFSAEPTSAVTIINFRRTLDPNRDQSTVTVEPPLLRRASTQDAFRRRAA
ncbi:MAG: hypothetical protein AAB553_03375 [Patescibacteria group bacterium]